jgi:hypothetical protein
MARTAATLPEGVRLTDKVTLGVFAKVFPVDAIKRTLAKQKKESVRNRDLPNHLVVYFAMLMSLFRDAATGEVLRCMFEGLEYITGRIMDRVTGRSGISQARSRVGYEPLKAVFDELAVPLASRKDKGAFFQDMRIVALDSTVFSVADSDENLGFFYTHCDGAYPQARVTALVECGTHALYAATIDPIIVSERAQAATDEILSKLEPGMICLADRGFTGFELFQRAADTGAKLLWRVRKDVILEPERQFSDGSYLAQIYCHLDKGRRNGLLVRVIEYKITDAKTKEVIRLITNILDPRSAKALSLAELYAERWEFEMTLDEIKTHMLGKALTLRSKTPELVYQELYGGFMAHYAVRFVMHDAARLADVDDDELSFTHSIRVIRRRLPRFGAFPPGRGLPGNSGGNFAVSSVVEPRTNEPARDKAQVSEISSDEQNGGTEIVQKSISLGCS